MATTKKATAKKSTTRTSATKATGPSKKSTAARKKPSTKKATATGSASSPKRTPLLERERDELGTDARYAVAGLAVDAVTLGKTAVAKIADLRAEVAKDPRGTVRNVAAEAPVVATKTVESVRHKLIVELEAAIRAFERTFDEKATEGRELVDALKQDTRVNRFLDQSASTRSQLKAALTSVTKTVDVATGAARKQADTASSQVKGAVTSVGKTVDAATEAAKKQADTAVSQVRAAATSVRRSAETVGDAADAATAKVDEAS